VGTKLGMSEAGKADDEQNAKPDVNVHGARDPQDTDHAAGEEHAAKNGEKEPPG
jgi:hypothetical protein